MSIQRFAGKGEPLYWFFGMIEDVDDPKQQGRVKVRAYTYHSLDKNILPTDQLMWARQMQPVTSAAVTFEGSGTGGTFSRGPQGSFSISNPNKDNTTNGGIGISPTGLKVGSTVWGIFVDGSDCQIPMVVGSYGSQTNGNNDVSKLARGINSIKDDLVGPEPKSAYKAKYPCNQVYTSPSGIVIEADDTPDNERIRIYHPSGTYTEIDHNGRLVNKVQDNSYEVVLKDKEVFVKGELKVTVIGNAKIEVDKDADINVKGNAKIDVNKDMNTHVGGNMTTTVDGDVTMNIKGNYAVLAQKVDLIADTVVDISGGKAVNISPNDDNE